MIADTLDISPVPDEEDGASVTPELDEEIRRQRRHAALKAKVRFRPSPLTNDEADDILAAFLRSTGNAEVRSAGAD